MSVEGNLKLRLASVALAGALLALPASAEDDKDPRPAAGIQDNSFLIEEAYNQEAGVVQHINTLRRQGRDWTYSFTQEWPLGSQTHQFSYSIPYLWLRSEGQRAQGLGDVMLNYRYQALMETATLPAFAPRLSLILPTGNKDIGTGIGSGFQVNLPFSKIVSDRVTLHFNAGMTRYFNIDGFHPTSFNLGGSVIYAVTRDFNFMLEGLVERIESVSGGALERKTLYTLSPGARYAFNFPDDAQLVVGLAFPIGFERRNVDYGVFLYVSLEHKFLGKK